MRAIAAMFAAMMVAAGASAQKAPTEAEVRAQVDEGLQQTIKAVQSGNPDAFLARFSPKGTMILRGVIGPDGTTMNTDLVGHEQVRPFLVSVGAPPDFGMTVTAFRRDGADAIQTGRWTVAGDQGGPFSLTWRRDDQGEWKIVTWRFDAG
jgi:Domain of unknown function (DUF4440)